MDPELDEVLVALGEEAFMGDGVMEEFPNIHDLFVYYNDLYFGGVLLGTTTVTWSTGRMTMCGGVCKYSPLGGCEIRLSEPILKFRPVRDLKMVLLHEMIHAYNFTCKIRDPDPGGHGPPFQELMRRINTSTVLDPQRPRGGYQITTTHSMHAEVMQYRVHWWECDRCKHIIKRSMNRPPQEADCRGRRGARGPDCSDPDCYYHSHIRKCGGTWVKIKEPEPKAKPPSKRPKKDKDAAKPLPPGQQRIDAGSWAAGGGGKASGGGGGGKAAGGGASASTSSGGSGAAGGAGGSGRAGGSKSAGGGAGGSRAGGGGGPGNAGGSRRGSSDGGAAAGPSGSGAGPAGAGLAGSGPGGPDEAQDSGPAGPKRAAEVHWLGQPRLAKGEGGSGGGPGGGDLGTARSGGGGGDGTGVSTAADAGPEAGAHAEGEELSPEELRRRCADAALARFGGGVSGRGRAPLPPKPTTALPTTRPASQPRPLPHPLPAARQSSQPAAAAQRPATAAASAAQGPASSRGTPTGSATGAARGGAAGGAAGAAGPGSPRLWWLQGGAAAPGLGAGRGAGDGGGAGPTAHGPGRSTTAPPSSSGRNAGATAGVAAPVGGSQQPARAAADVVSLLDSDDEGEGSGKGDGVVKVSRAVAGKGAPSVAAAGPSARGGGAGPATDDGLWEQLPPEVLGGWGTGPKAALGAGAGEAGPGGGQGAAGSGVEVVDLLDSDDDMR
ncbi:hypothetical protein HYH03_001779 [Edaphochlamys debaryana]|uniref:SprT-like domain-containing protein n=1 Tax=Edaphochlamys debaryana TaxID=47281 RepID=A0A836C5T8_9CHLO|nr:hypothetical protein HYH03_001779 [Edaphochlamys debaryana]|eukprot:KAG2500199.1 hypothetical protein HYH03_001779 [Edaphochlamys debaryana]